LLPPVHAPRNRPACPRIILFCRAEGRAKLQPHRSQRPGDFDALHAALGRRQWPTSEEPLRRVFLRQRCTARTGVKAKEALLGHYLTGGHDATNSDMQGRCHVCSPWVRHLLPGPARLGMGMISVLLAPMDQHCAMTSYRRKRKKKSF
jgi:hypothetical protein